jgi:hypothetical protein
VNLQTITRLTATKAANDSMCRQADTATHTRKKLTEQRKTNVSRKTKRKPLRPVSTGSNLGLGLGELKQNWS